MAKTSRPNTGAGISDEELAGLLQDSPEASQQVELDQLKQKISALLAQNEALAKQIEEAPEIVKASADTSANVSRASTKARYAIVIEEGREQHDSPDVFVGVNGRSYLIKRGQRVEVPPDVLEVLDHAIIDRHIPQADERTGLPNGTITRASRRFPYQNLGLVINSDGTRINN